MQFENIVLLDDCGLCGPSKDKIFALSRSPVHEVDADPKDQAEILARIRAGGPARSPVDCLLLSWRTRLGAEAIAACPGLKYVGLCCTFYGGSSCNVDLEAANARGIVVKGVRDYGDQGTLEFIFAQLINLFKGLGMDPVADQPTELGSRTLGVIGMGTLGKMVARAALAFGTRVVYFSRTRKAEIEAEGVEYLELEELLARSDVVSLHVPRNNLLLEAAQFAAMKPGAVLVNTSLGRPFDPAALFEWIRRDVDSRAIFDLPGAEAVLAFGASHPRVLVWPSNSGFTREAKIRLTDKVLLNMQEYLRSAG